MATTPDATAEAPTAPTTTSDVPNQIPQGPTSQDVASQTLAGAQPVPTTTAQPTGQMTEPHHRSLMGDILHAIGEVLGGPSTRSQVNPTTGAIEQVPLSRTQRIANTAGIYLRGAAAGAAQHGPGAAGKAALAGVNEQQQTQQQQQENLRAESANVRATSEANIQRQLMNASLAKMSQEHTRAALDLRARQQELDEHQIALGDAMMQISNIPGAKEIASFNTNDEIAQHLESVGPKIAQQYAVDMARNDLRVVMGPDGKAHAFQIPKKAGETAIGEGHKLLSTDPSKIDPKTKLPMITETNADPRMTWDEYQRWNGNEFSKYNAAVEQKTKIAEQVSATTKNTAEAGEAVAGTHLKEAQAATLAGGKKEDGTWDQSSIPVALVEGNMDPSQLSKRATDYNAKLQQASQYSMEKYGKPFNIAQAQEDYKFAINAGTQNTLKYLNSLTGADNKSGNLGALVSQSDSITRTKFPALNDVAAWGRLQSGDPAMASYYATVTEVADQVAKILQGGSGSGTSDAKLKQASELFQKGFNKQQIKSVADTLRTLLANRKGELIGNNRYLEKQYGTHTPAAPQGPPAGAAGTAMGNDGKSYYVDAKGTILGPAQ